MPTKYEDPPETWEYSNLGKDVKLDDMYRDKLLIRIISIYVINLITNPFCLSFFSLPLEV